MTTREVDNAFAKAFNLMGKMNPTELRAKIQKNTEAKELFNTKKYTSIWEQTLEILHNRWKEGKQPEDMEI